MGYMKLTRATVNPTAVPSRRRTTIRLPSRVTREPQGCDVPCLRRKAAEARENGVSENAERHRPHAANPIAEPSKDDSPRRGANEERRHDDAEPLVLRRWVDGEFPLQESFSALGRPAETCRSQSRRTSSREAPRARPSICRSCYQDWRLQRATRIWPFGSLVIAHGMTASMPAAARNEYDQSKYPRRGLWHVNRVKHRRIADKQLVLESLEVGQGHSAVAR